MQSMTPYIDKINKKEQAIIDFVAKVAPNADFYELQGLLNVFNQSVYEYGYNYAREYFQGE